MPASQKKAEIKVREIPINELLPDSRNANRHTDRGRELVSKSMRELGAGRSVLTDKDGTLIAGNLTTETAKEAGITKAIVVQTTGDTLVVVERTDLDLNSTDDPRARQMALIDNSSALVGIDFDFEIAEEIGGDFGFDVADWGIEIPEETEAPEAEDDNFNAPPPKEPITVLGDLYELHSTEAGLKHRVHCGDSTDSDAVARLMGGKMADLVFTDPPYNVQFNGRSGKFDVIKNDDLSNEDFAEFIQGFVSVLKILNPPAYYVWCNWKFYGILQNLLDFKACIVWAKNVFGLGRGYRHQHEFCLFNGVIDEEIKNESDLWSVTKDSQYLHPTQKPIELAARALQNHSAAKTIVDFFLGSGSTLIASEQLNRNCYGQELDPAYTDVIIRRWVTYMRDNNKKHIVYRNGEQLPEEEIERYFKED